MYSIRIVLVHWKSSDDILGYWVIHDAATFSFSADGSPVLQLQNPHAFVTLQDRSACFRPTFSSFRDH